MAILASTHGRVTRECNEGRDDDDAGRFDQFLWQFVGGRAKMNAWRSLNEVPATTADADGLCTDLKRSGFTFVGPTICDAFMQADGMVNHHLLDCFRHAELKRLPP